MKGRKKKRNVMDEKIMEGPRQERERSHQPGGLDASMPPHRGGKDIYQVEGLLTTSFSTYMIFDVLG